jgi:hypothetical protein
VTYLVLKRPPIPCIETIATSQSNHNITIQLQYDYTITIGQVSDHGIPFRTFQTLEKCPFHVEINERKIKK